MGQNGTRPIQKGRKIRSYLYGDWRRNGYWYWCLYRNQSLVSK